MNKYDLSPNKFVTLHPGGGGQAKWPPAGLLAGAARFFCEKSGATPVVIQGPADREPTASFQRAWGRWLPVIQTERLEVLGALLSKASGFLGGDSGVSHLAALSGAPTAALYGPGSNMARWHPLGPRAFFVPWETDGEEIAERLAMLSAKGDCQPAQTVFHELHDHPSYEATSSRGRANLRDKINNPAHPFYAHFLYHRETIEFPILCIMNCLRNPSFWLCVE